MTKRLLYVDSDESCLDRIQSELGKNGFEVDSLADTTRCISRLESRSHRVLLLAESSFSEPSFPLLRDVKQRDGSIEVLLLIPPQLTTTVLKAFRLGADYCFFKPLDQIDPLASALEAVFVKIDQQWASVLRTTRDSAASRLETRSDRTARDGEFWLTADAPASPESIPSGRERRSEPRTEFRAPAWAVPIRDGTPQHDEAFQVVTQDISTRGLGLVAEAPVFADELLVCLTALDPDRVFHVEVRSRTQLDGGASRLGVQVRKILECPLALPMQSAGAGATA